MQALTVFLRCSLDDVDVQRDDVNWPSSALLKHSFLSNMAPFSIGRLSSDSTKPRYVVPYTPKVDHVLSLYFTPCIGPCSNRCEVLPPIIKKM